MIVPGKKVKCYQKIEKDWLKYLDFHLQVK